jgi:glycogen debranching enzyme
LPAAGLARRCRTDRGVRPTGSLDGTDFWLTARRAPGAELAPYQHGNDSGWDNATAFDAGRVVGTADLAAFLILRMHELAELAAQLREPDEARRWTRAAEETQAALLDQLWTGDRFVARGVDSGTTWSSAGLLDLMPVVLGEHLPGDIGSALADRLRAHLTPYGLATGVTTSPHYVADGYWRGPIWAPATVLIEDGLRRAGHRRFADDISARFRALCETHGFAENFDALTGTGLRDRAYTWTASSYLLLAEADAHRDGDLSDQTDQSDQGDQRDQRKLTPWARVSSPE